MEDRIEVFSGMVQQFAGTCALELEGAMIAVKDLVSGEKTVIFFDGRDKPQKPQSKKQKRKNHGK